MLNETFSPFFYQFQAFYISFLCSVCSCLRKRA